MRVASVRIGAKEGGPKEGACRDTAGAEALARHLEPARGSRSYWRFLFKEQPA